MSGEQLYSDTQMLLLNIAKSLPAGTRVVSIRDLIDKGEQAGRGRRNEELINNCVIMKNNCQKLVELGWLKEADNYDRLRVDGFKGLKNIEEQLDRVDSDIARFFFFFSFLFFPSSSFSLFSFPFLT